MSALLDEAIRWFNSVWFGLGLPELFVPPMPTADVLSEAIALQADLEQRIDQLANPVRAML